MQASEDSGLWLWALEMTHLACISQFGQSSKALNATMKCIPLSQPGGVMICFSARIFWSSLFPASLQTPPRKG